MADRRKRSTSGETIVESLVSTLIIVLVSIFLVNAIITAAHVNALVKDVDYSYDASSPRSMGTVDVSIAGTDVPVEVYEVNANSGDATYYYYE